MSRDTRYQQFIAEQAKTQAHRPSDKPVWGSSGTLFNSRPRSGMNAQRTVDSLLGGSDSGKLSWITPYPGVKA